jgi:hypothetical protein
MAESTTTLRQVFLIPASDGENGSPEHWKAFQEKLSSELKGIKCPVPFSALAVKIGELFDIEVPDLLLGWWEKAEDLKRALAESREEPDEVRYLGLAEHSISSEHHPYVEVKIKNASVKKIELSIQLLFNLKGFVLKIQNGQITHIETGRCEVEGTVKYEELVILEKKLAPFDLPGSISLSARDKTRSAA